MYDVEHVYKHKTVNSCTFEFQESTNEYMLSFIPVAFSDLQKI